MFLRCRGNLKIKLYISADDSFHKREDEGERGTAKKRLNESGCVEVMRSILIREILKTPYLTCVVIEM